MPLQHSPPAKNTRSQRNPVVLTPTARVPLDNTPSIHQLSANLNRGPPMEGEEPSRRGGMKSRRSIPFSSLLRGYPGMFEGARAILGEAEDEEGEDSVEEEDSGETEVADAPEVPQGSTLAPTNQPIASQSDPSLLKMMKQMNESINGATHSSVCSHGQFQSPCFQDSINKST
ncbi:hypothetical protein O181_108389 [Austropuccinia psidii MF-1]|uniref:Uncharacterized protein n=1 Tax=Austropuccinia psidii MF-1 TaxID=1389203 RepID=A0A9Q3JVZ0_9BASI|nr:hypothetical protein [Austropuccinia psidii MF-1]